MPIPTVFSVIWMYDTFKNKFCIRRNSAKYSKMNFGLDSDEHFHFKIF